MLRRELGIWRRLDHKNVRVVPFLGIARGFGMHGVMSLISLWMPNSTLESFLKEHEDELSTAHRLQLLLNIAHGLEYMHSFAVSGAPSPVIHGDLYPMRYFKFDGICPWAESRQNNVLIDADYTARLTDFGFASLVGEIPEALNYLQWSTARPGALRRIPPEQISGDPEVKRSTKSDVYSFGDIHLQVLSGKHPCSEIPEDNILGVVVCLSKGQKPSRAEYRPIDDRHWEFDPLFSGS